MSGALTRERIQSWKRDPVRFVLEVLRDENGERYVLYPAQRAYLREALRLTPEGRLVYPEQMYSAIKKSGKTEMAAWIALYVATILGGAWAAVYAIANDYDQSVGRVFEAARRLVERSPILRGTAKITADRIEFKSTSSFIQAVTSSYSSLAGINPSLTICDELWAFTSERSNRLFDEAVPSPTRKISGRLVTTTAGFSGESALLEGLYQRGLKGREIAPSLYSQDGYLMYWGHDPVAPWQDEKWLAQMRQQLRPNAYIRLYENRFVAAESTFVSLEDFDACTDPALGPVFSAPKLGAWIGLDASVRNDMTAIVVATRENDGRVRVLWHHAIQPSKEKPIDFEHDIADLLRELVRRYQVRTILFDPFQLEAVSQALIREGLPMQAYTQTINNLTPLANNLYQLFRSRRILLYQSDELRRAVMQTAINEGERGFKLSKLKQSQRIDLTVAMAMAALGAVKRMGYAPARVAFFGSDPREALAELFGGDKTPPDPDLPIGDIISGQGLPPDYPWHPRPRPQTPPIEHPLKRGQNY